MSKYLLDSNYWISAGNFYPQDLFPSFWDSMETLIQAGEVVIHQTVLDEIDRKEDQVSQWLHSVEGWKPIAISEEAFQQYLDCCRWAEDEAQGYTKGAISEFEQNSRADAWICAAAAVSDYVLVTDERKSNSSNHVKIPNVCEAFNIGCITNLDFMRVMKFSF